MARSPSLTDSSANGSLAERQACLKSSKSFASSSAWRITGSELFMAFVTRSSILLHRGFGNLLYLTISNSHYDQEPTRPGSAGVSPAISPIRIVGNPAGGTPALPGAALIMRIAVSRFSRLFAGPENCDGGGISDLI